MPVAQEIHRVSCSHHGSPRCHAAKLLSIELNCPMPMVLVAQECRVAQQRWPIKHAVLALVHVLRLLYPPTSLRYVRVPDDHRHPLPDQLTLQAALTEMRFPGMLCVAMPVSTGLIFRWVGSMTERPMLGAEARP